MTDVPFWYEQFPQKEQQKHQCKVEKSISQIKQINDKASKFVEAMSAAQVKYPAAHDITFSVTSKK
jgi:hypothetical protein